MTKHNYITITEDDLDKDEGPGIARVLFRLFLWILYILFVYGVFVGY